MEIELVVFPNENQAEVEELRNKFTIQDAFDLIKQNVNNENEVFKIDEDLKLINQQKLNQLRFFIQNHQVIAFESNLDGKFCIIWKNNEDFFVLYMFDNVNKEKLNDLCEFLVEFLQNCLNQNYPGISSFELDKINKLNVNLTSLTDLFNLNLLFHAAKSGNSKIVKILLEVNFNINNQLAVNLAYENQQFETVMVLMRANSKFPDNFNINNCSDDIKEFAEMTKTFHKHIEAGEVDEIKEFLIQNPNLRYFFNLNNESASAVAIKSKKFDIYELLMSQNLYFSVSEDMDDVMADLDEDEREKVTEIHFKYKKEIQQEQHLSILMSKSSVGHDNFNIQEKLDHVSRTFGILNAIPAVRVLLKLASLLPDLHIVFDFNRDSVQYLDPSKDKFTAGLFYGNGRILVGASQLLDSLTEHEVFATIAHELCHYVLFNVFGNFAKPYKVDDEETKLEFEEISQKCQSKKLVDDIIDIVYGIYDEEFHHAELIVRVPHLYAHYVNSSEILESVKSEFESLFEFYESKLMLKLEEKIDELKEIAEKEKRMKDKKISNLKLALIVVALVLTAVAVFVGFSVHNPTYKWSELDDEQKAKIYNGKIKFEGIELKFHEIYGKNESSEVFGVLNSEEIKILMAEKSLDLNKPEYEHLESKIFLTYRNLTEKLKSKVENSVIEFQGEKVKVNSLLKNDTEEILSLLNSEQIFDLIKNQSKIQIDQKLINDTEIYIERKFNKILSSEQINRVKQIEIFPEDLIFESLTTKVFLLSANAGDGKTTIFKNFALKFKQMFPLKWIVFIDLKDHIEVYKKHKKLNLDILTEILDLKDLSIEIFKKIYEAGNVVFVFDGFDEISPIYTQFMLNLMLQMKTETKNIQFISTRPHYQTVISDSLDCKAYRFVQYSENDEEEYIEKFYNLKRLNMSEKKVARQKVEFMMKILKNYTESPLLLAMIVELTLSSEELNVTNYYSIYEAYVNIKLKISRTKGEIVSNDKDKLTFKYSLKEILQYFSLKLLCGEISEHGTYKKLEITQKFRKEKIDINELSRLGILTIFPDGDIEFAHRTFEEFFIAQYFVDHIFKAKDNPGNQEIETRIEVLLETILENDEESIIKSFLDQNNSKPKIFVNKSQKIAEKIRKIFLRNLEQKNIVKTLTATFKVMPYKDIWDEALAVDKNTNLFNLFAIINPEDFITNFDDIKEFTAIYYPNEPEMQEKLLFGKHQQGNFLYGAYRQIMDEEINWIFSFEEFLSLTKIKIKFSTKKFMKLHNFSSFFKYFKAKLTFDEICELLVTNSYEINKESKTNDWKKTFDQKQCGERGLKIPKAILPLYS